MKSVTKRQGSKVDDSGRSAKRNRASKVLDDDEDDEDDEASDEEDVAKKPASGKGKTSAPGQSVVKSAEAKPEPTRTHQNPLEPIKTHP